MVWPWVSSWPIKGNARGQKQNQIRQVNNKGHYFKGVNILFYKTTTKCLMWSITVTVKLDPSKYDNVNTWLNPMILIEVRYRKSTSWCDFLSYKTRGRRGRMVVGFTTTYAISAYPHRCCEFESRSGRGLQHYVIKFVSDLRQVGGFLRVFRFPPPIKLTATI